MDWCGSENTPNSIPESPNGIDYFSFSHADAGEEGNHQNVRGYQRNSELTKPKKGLHSFEEVSGMIDLKYITDWESVVVTYFLKQQLIISTSPL